MVGPHCDGGPTVGAHSICLWIGVIWKGTLRYVWTGKTEISLHICAVWSESSLLTYTIYIYWGTLKVQSDVPYQFVQMGRLILIFYQCIFKAGFQAISSYIKSYPDLELKCVFIISVFSLQEQIDLGLVVQSIVSLKSLLRGQLVKCFTIL